MKKSIICLILILAVILTMFTACKPDEPQYVEPTEPQIPSTGKKILQNGQSEYKIVIPENAARKEILAKDELVLFFKKATGVQLPVISDIEAEYNTEFKYLSIGKTTLLAASGIQLSSDELTNDGYKVVTKGNIVFMAGASDYGTLYATYFFMNKSFGYKAYAEDEVVYDKVSEMELLNFNVTDIPDFEQRQLGYYSTSQSELYRDRLRVTLHGDDWIYASHSHFSIMPKDKYYNEHPDWYSKDGTQLCLTNEEMRKEFVSNLKITIANHPNEHYILLGEEDSNTFCNCDNCKAALEKYGTPSGVDMAFVNKVARDINTWLAETNPDREFYIGTFAYLKTFDPPVHKDEQSGKYVPNHQDVVAEDNVFVFIAPLHANYSYGFTEDENAIYREGFNGWQTITDIFCIWTYSANYYNYFVNFNNWSTQAMQYGELQSFGSKSVIDLGAWDTGSPSFEALRIYLISELMWDNTLDTQKLTKNFFDNYYKDASPYINQYFDLMRTYSEHIRSEFQLDATCYVNYRQQKYWSKGYLDQCTELFNKALASVEKYKQTDPSLHEKLVNRIKLEKLSIDFLMLDFYQSSFTPAQQTAMIDEFESVARLNNILYWHEHTNLAQGDDGNIAAVINGWRIKIG